MPEVEIEYCVPCGLRERAEAVQKDLLDTFEEQLDALRLKMGHGGVFKVRVDGELIYDKPDQAFDMDTIEAAVRERLDGA